MECQSHAYIGERGDERHWLIPKRSNTVYEVIEEYGDGDALWRMKVSPQARKKNPNLPEYWDVRAITYDVQGKTKTVLTSLPPLLFSIIRSNKKHIYSCQL